MGHRNLSNVRLGNQKKIEGCFFSFGSSTVALVIRVSYIIRDDFCMVISAEQVVLWFSSVSSFPVVTLEKPRDRF